MKRVLSVTTVLLLVLTGCVTVQKTVRERVDQDISGNRGYVEGKSEEAPVAKSPTREYIDVKVEIPTWEEFTGKLPKEKAKATPNIEAGEGNRGYISQTPVKEPEAYRSEYTPEVQMAPEREITTQPRAATTYKVKQGDSLSKIAKKFYGKTSKWNVIYEANMNKIKDPQNIKPGIELVIPGVQEAESKNIK